MTTGTETNPPVIQSNILKSSIRGIDNQVKIYVNVNEFIATPTMDVVHSGGRDENITFVPFLNDNLNYTQNYTISNFGNLDFIVTATDVNTNTSLDTVSLNVQQVNARSSILEIAGTSRLFVSENSFNEQAYIFS